MRHNSIVQYGLLEMAVVWIFCAFALAQAPGTGSTVVPTPGGRDYFNSLSENFDPANGSVSLRLAVPIPSGRGFSVPFNFAYDSNGVFVPGNLGEVAQWKNIQIGYASKGGWAYTLPAAATDLEHYKVPYGHGYQNCPYYTNWRFLDAKGRRHGLGLYNQNGGKPCGTGESLNGGDLTLQAVLSSKIAADPSFLTLADDSGTVYTFGSSGAVSKIEDTNGNIVRVQDNGSGNFSVTDTAGRVALSSSGFGSSGDTVTVSGLGGSYQLAWQAMNYNFSTDWTLLQQGNYTCAPSDPVQGSFPVVQNIKQPNGEEFTFQYDSTHGLLNQVTYPTGAWIEYTWALNGSSVTAFYSDSNGDPEGCLWRFGKPAISTRTVSFDGVNAALKQTFQYSTTWQSNSDVHWSSKQTTVTTQDLIRGTSFTTTYVYAPVASGEPLPTYFGGINSSETDVPAEQTVTYRNTNNSTLQTAQRTWLNAQQLATEQIILDNGQQSQVSYGYGPGGAVTEKDEYDFGSSGHGPLLRKSITNYQSFSATPIFSAAPSILNRPCQVITYDGSGNRYAETDYEYDGGNSACGLAGTPSTVSVSN